MDNSVVIVGGEGNIRGLNGNGEKYNKNKLINLKNTQIYLKGKNK